MALVTTILGVVGVLGGISLLLWLLAVIEAKQLGPLDTEHQTPAPAQPEAARAPAALQAMSMDNLGTAA